MDLIQQDNGKEFSLYGWVNLRNDALFNQKLFEIVMEDRSLIKIVYKNEGNPEESEHLEIEYLQNEDGTYIISDKGVTMNTQNFYFFIYSMSFEKQKHYFYIIGPDLEQQFEFENELAELVVP